MRGRQENMKPSTEARAHIVGTINNILMSMKTFKGRTKDSQETTGIASRAFGCIFLRKISPKLAAMATLSIMARYVVKFTKVRTKPPKMDPKMDEGPIQTRKKALWLPAPQRVTYVPVLTQSKAAPMPKMALRVKTAAGTADQTPPIHALYAMEPAKMVRLAESRITNRGAIKDDTPKV